jgi:hypothetical protein
MFFIARCIFWLSIVYAHMPATDGASQASAFMDMAASHADAFARQAALKAATDATTLCRADPATCIGLAMAATGTGATKSTDVARSADAVKGPETASGPKVAAKGVIETKGVVDTLTPADRQPHWQGPKARARS